jgi:hypothetical protein
MWTVAPPQGTKTSFRGMKDKGALCFVIPSVAVRARTKRMGDVVMNWCGQ